jgi:oligopeptide transport system substrate-binding protein
MVASGACGPAPQTVVVQETYAVAGTVVAVEKAATATPEPAPMELVPTQAAPATASDPEREALWYPISADPETLDPYGAISDAMGKRDQDFNLIGQCMEGLYEYRGNGAIEPVGALGFEISDDGRVYTIRLREDVVWSDGQPVIAQHYVDSVFRQLDMEGDRWELYDVEGAEAYDTGEATDPASVGVRAVDDYTLEIRLAQPAPYFETILPSYLFYPIRLDVIEAHGARWTDPGNYVCNGAYLLKDWVRGQKVVFVKNPGYWNADLVTIERITFSQDADALASYENDDLHAISGGGFLYRAQDYVMAHPVLSQEVQLTSASGLFYLGLNTLRSPTDEVRVRKALALAIDHQSIFEELLMFKDWEPPACTIPPLVMGHQPRGTCGHPYDPEQAQALLAEASYPGGEGFPTLHVWINWGSWLEGAIEMIAAMWEKSLGIETEVHATDRETYWDYLDECRVNREAMAACELNLYGGIGAWTMAIRTTYLRYGLPLTRASTIPAGRMIATRSCCHWPGWNITGPSARNTTRMRTGFWSRSRW